MRQTFCKTDLAEIVKNKSKYFSIITLAFLFFILGHSSLNAQYQFYTMPHNSMEELVTDTGFIRDSGGELDNYFNNSHDTLVIIPETKGKFIRILFDTYSFEECCDKLYIYDGLNTSAPLIGIYTGVTVYPEKVSATNEDGALTLVFISNESVNYYGFEAWIFTEDTAYPDAGISNEILYSDTLLAGKKFFCRTIISNYSSEPFDSLLIQYYLSTDSIYDDEDLMLNHFFHLNTPPQYVHEEYFAPLISGDTPEGRAYIITRLTDPQGQYDGLPANNLFVNSVVIKIPVIDLSLSQIELSHIILSPDKTETIHFIIKNESNEPNITTKVGFYLSNNIELDNDDIKISETVTLNLSNPGLIPITHYLKPSVPTATSDGIYYLLMNVDDDSIMPETNENNNILITQVIFKNNPITDTDSLVLKDLELLADTIVNGSTLQASFTMQSDILNNSYILNYAYLSNDTILDTESDMYLSQFSIYLTSTQQQFEQYITLNTSDSVYGQHYLFIAVDINQSSSFTPVFIDSIHTTDINIKNVVVSPDSTLNDQFIGIFCSLENNGSVNIPQTKITYYISSDELYDSSDILLTSKNTNTIPGFHSTIYTSGYIAGIAPGEYYMLCIADPDSLIEETDESNNIAVTSFKIIEPETITKYDLELTSVICAQTMFENSSAYSEMDYFFHNSKAEKVNFACYLSADSIFDLTDFSNELFSYTQAIQPYRSVKKQNFIHINEIESAGKYYLIFKADNHNHLTEDDELNNVIIKPVNLRKTLQSIAIITNKIEFSNLIFGSEAEVRGNISYHNTGNKTADSIVIEVFLSPLNDPENDIPMMKQTIGNETSGQTVPVQFTIPESMNVGLYDMTIKLQPKSNEVVADTSGIEEHLTIGIQDYDVDLEMKEFTVHAQDVYSNGYIIALFSLINNGTTVFNDALFSFYLSEDDVLSEDDYNVHSSYIENVAIQSLIEEQRVFYISDTIPSGSYYLFVVADSENNIIETSETNNTLMTEVVIIQKEMNLSLENMVLSASKISYNRSLQIDCTVRNTGNLSTGYSYIGFYLSADSVLDDSDKIFHAGNVNGMAPNAFQQINIQTSFSSDYDAGRYFIICKADYQDRLTESNENDNFKWEGFDLEKPMYDLEITNSLIEDTLNLTKDNYEQIALSIANNENSSLSTYLSTSFYLSTDSIFNPIEDIFAGISSIHLSIPSGNINRSLEVKIPSVIKNGDYYLFIWIDSKNDLPETNELNNFYRIPVKLVDPDVDLIIYPIDPPDTVSVNSYLNINYEVKNQGETSTGSYFYTRMIISTDTVVSVDDQTIDTRSIQTLPGNSNYDVLSQVFLSYELNEGQHYIILETDIYRNITETDEENNITYFPIYIKGSQMDLMVTNPVITPDETSPSNMIYLSCKIENVSNEHLNKSSYIAYYLSNDSLLDHSDGLIKSTYIGYMDANSNTTKSHYYYAPQLNPGTYYILFVADYQNSIKEINEENNIRAIPFEITGPKPDYVLYDYQYQFRNDSMYMDASIINLGQDVLLPTFCSLVFTNDSILNDDNVIHYMEIKPLAYVDSISITYKTALPSANFTYFFFNADGKDQVDESDEINNLYFGQLPESKADIEIDLPFQISMCYAGDTIEVEYSLLNNGRRSSGLVNIKYCLSSDENIDNSDFMLHTGEIHSCEPKENIPVTQKLIIPEDVPDGDYRLIIEGRIDDGSIAESDYQNNKSIIYYQINSLAKVNTTNKSTSKTIIYPNPTTQFLNIKAGYEIKEYKIFNSMGMSITNGEVNSDTYTIDINNFRPGLYFLVLKINNNQEVLRFEVAY